MRSPCVDAQTIVEQKSDLPFEAVEPGQGILTQAEQEIGMQVRAVDSLHQLVGKTAGFVFAGMIEEILFELVQTSSSSLSVLLLRNWEARQAV